MTPTAVTPAARGKRPSATRPGDSARSPHPSTPRSKHRAPVQRTAVPRSPRRVSGPARPAASTRTSQRTAPQRTVPQRTAPQRPAPPRRARRAPRTVHAPLSARALARLRTLPDHSLLDRVVRGRLWIPLLGVLLAGIVTMQVEVLKLNASIGHSVVSAAQMQSENQTLRAEVSHLGDAGRIEREAAALGMTMPAATQPLYLPGSASSNLQRALSNIHAPDPTAFAGHTSARAAQRAALVTATSGA